VSVVEVWSQRVACRVAPLEVDCAAEVGVAYAAGGRARRDLFEGSDVPPGAFGAGELAEALPLIIRSLAQAGDAISAMLSSAYLSNGLAAASLLVALKEHRAARSAASKRNTDAGGSQTVEAGTGSAPGVGFPGAPGLSQPAGHQLSERELVDQAFGTLGERLRSAGFAAEQADQIAFDLLVEFLTDAAAAADADRFIAALSAVPDQPPRPPGTRKGRWLHQAWQWLRSRLARR
jgi:hypothetical protein